MKGLWGVKQWRVLQASALFLLGALFVLTNNGITLDLPLVTR